MVSHHLKQFSTILGISAFVLALCVIVLGSYTRLVDAGLGCPDWPGCYGTILPPMSQEAQAIANQAFPERPVEIEKTWPEMIHRYLATGLGFLILLLAVASVINHKHPAQPTKLSLTLLALVCFQGALGMWTVTMKLYPPIVMLHLLGGFTVICLITLYIFRITQVFQPLQDMKSQKLKSLAMLAFIVVAVQIALGGWTAANYAAHICHELPICQSGWTQGLAFKEAFQIFGHEVIDFEYAPHLSANAQMTIHVTHRIGAIITTVIVGLLAFLLWSQSETQRYKNFSIAVTFALLLQLGLGLANVIFGIPVWIAVAHNLFGAILLLCLLALNYSLRKKP